MRPLRDLPVVGIVDPTGYAHLICQGWDTYQEAVNVEVPQSLAEMLDAAKTRAAEMDERGGQAVSISFGGVSMQVAPYGLKGGITWAVGNDDFLIMISRAARDWSVSVRYLAAGLWEYGLDHLMERMEGILCDAGLTPKGDDWRRPSRADWAFDIYSPAFTKEMRPELVNQLCAHHCTKQNTELKVSTWGHSSRLETLTIGKDRSGLQIQVYDKLREIKEASGKTWMIDLWRREGLEPPDDQIRDMWRLEVRMGSDFLKDRNIRAHAQLTEFLPALLSEALMTRRLGQPQGGDSRKRRWPMHPMWARAYLATEASAMLPLGRYVTGARNAVSDQLAAQIAGTIRSRMVLDGMGEFRPGDFDQVMKDVREILLSDQQGPQKVEKAAERYRYIDEAR